LESIADLEAVVCRAGSTLRAIGPELFAQTDLTGKAVLVHTGWDQFWRSEHYFEGHPFLTLAGAEWLKAAGATLVEIDSLNIDDTGAGERPYSILLGAEIPIVEHLCHLDQLSRCGSNFMRCR
jgi:kynurenine formamidase